ncbi:MAG TPA: universal stress protein [Gaiellaceae bacterium]|nr:universal stress protein [Gaiellaceae bacterium]
MFDTIVWATDASELADRALPFVTELAKTHHSRIVAVHANELLHGRYGGAPLLADEPDIRAKIERQVVELRDQGFDVELELPAGGSDVAVLIAKAAEAVKADLIVVGTHGHGAIASAVLGSVARSLLHASRCPVLAIPSAVREPARTA